MTQARPRPSVLLFPTSRFPKEHLATSEYLSRTLNPRAVSRELHAKSSAYRCWACRIGVMGRLPRLYSRLEHRMKACCRREYRLVSKILPKALYRQICSQTSIKLGLSSSQWTYRSSLSSRRNSRGLQPAESCALVHWTFTSSTK
jgi:hypothetical protein